MAAATRSVLAFRPDLPGAARLCQQVSLVDSAVLPAGSGAAGRSDSGAAVPPGKRPLVVEPESRALGLPDDLLRLGRRGFVEQLPAGNHADSAPTTKVDYARHRAGHHALHAVLRTAVSVWSDAFPRH